MATHRTRQQLPAVAVPALLLTLSSLPTISAEPITLQPGSALSYVPSLSGNAVVCALYALLTLAMFFLTFKHRSYWALCQPIGALFSALGYGLRLLLRYNENQESRAIYIPMYLFVVLSPACYLAFNYIVGGRLIVAVTAMGTRAEKDTPSPSPQEVAAKTGCCGRRRKAKGGEKGKSPLKQKSPFSLLPPRLYTTIFVLSDVITFLIQAAGGSMLTSDDLTTLDIGANIFLAGVILQTVSYLFFFAIICHSHWKLYQVDPATYGPMAGLKRREPAITLFFALYLTGIFIIVRSIFRAVENAQGFDGTLYSVEIYTFLLDALPLLIVLIVFVVWWPASYLQRTHPSEPVKEYLRSRGLVTSGADSVPEKSEEVAQA